MSRTRAFLRTPFAAALIALALAVRVMLPAGWMPASGQGVAIMLCSGTDMATGWVDAEGRVHKEKPAGEMSGGEHCAFAGMAQALIGSDPLPAIVLPRVAHDETQVRLLDVAVGQGLAAPPPPATGPPAIA